MLKNLLVYIHTKEEIILERLQYVLEFISLFPNLKQAARFVFKKPQEKHLTINYGGKPEKNVFHLPAQLMFFKERKIDVNKLEINSYTFQDITLYSVENELKEVQVFLQDQNFGFDVFESIFFHLSRYEEWFGDKNDLGNTGMLQQEKILVKRKSVEQYPVVDLLVSSFCSALGIEVENKPSPYILTHDIDKIYKYNNHLDALKAFVWPIVFQRNIMWGIRSLGRYFSVRKGASKDPYDSYDFLFRSSEKWHTKIVYFMAGGRTAFDLFDAFYEKDFSEVWSSAKNKGYEIGLHPSFDTVDDGGMMKKEKNKLQQMSGENISHTRQHFLHFLLNKTCQHIQKSGFSLDSSLGFTRWIGFRTGTGFKHYLYDFPNEKPFDFQEQPLIIMDSSLIHQSGDDMDEFKSVLFSFLKLNKRGTRITFNFHNSTFDSTLKKRKDLYSILDELEVMMESF